MKNHGKSGKSGNSKSSTAISTLEHRLLGLLIKGSEGQTSRFHWKVDENSNATMQNGSNILPTNRSRFNISIGV